MKKLVILGAGTGGIVAAATLAKRLDRAEWTITVIDRDNDHYYQPGFLFVPFGVYKESELRKDKSRLIPKGVEFLVAEVERIDPAGNAVVLRDGCRVDYHLLVVSTGADVCPAETSGMVDGWRDTIFDFYTPSGATALAEKLKGFRGGTLAVHITEMPIKCPVAPLEFTFLSDWHFARQGIRDAVDIVFVTPLSGAFTKPVASRALGRLLEERKIRTVADFNVERVDAGARRIVGYDGREVGYDLLVTVPTNMGSEMVERSGLGDELRFIPTEPGTLRAKASENIFVIGDATNLPSSKAGSVVHFQAETLAENVLREIAGKPLEPGFDGHANCFVETGRGQAILIDFNYDTEPLPGRFPFPGIGPMPLLKPSRINHLGKLAFRWIYWNLLLKARPIPFIPARMKMAGKKRPKDM